jgi:hypothetical protein
MTALTDAAEGYLRFRRAFGHDLSLDPWTRWLRDLGLW